MPTAKQSAASRANSQKSTGPRTTAGKANSRFNALKHGIDAKQQVTFAESEEDLALLAAEYHELHSPADAAERFLVDTLIDTEWRLRRLRRVGADLWRSAHNLFMEENPEVKSVDCGDAFIGSGPAFERLQRIVNSCDRQYRNARKELQEAQVARAHGLRPPQPEEVAATSESPASFRTSPETPETAVPAAPITAPAAPQSPEFIQPAPAEMAERATAQMGDL